MSGSSELCSFPYRKKCYEKEVYSKNIGIEDVAETNHTWNSVITGLFQTYKITRNFKIKYSRSVTSSSNDVSYFVTRNYLDLYGCGGLSESNTSYDIFVSENTKEQVENKIYCNYKTNCYLTENITRTISFDSKYSGDSLPKRNTSILASLAMFGGVWHAKFVVKALITDITTYLLNAPSTEYKDEIIHSAKSEKLVQLPCLLWRPVGSTEQLQTDEDIDMYGYYNPLDDKVDAGGADYYMPRYLRENCINKNYLQNRAWQRYYTDLNIKTQGYVPTRHAVSAGDIKSITDTLGFKPNSNIGSDAFYLEGHLAAFDLNKYGIASPLQKSIPLEIVSKIKELNNEFSVVSIV